ncbi:hypothetical protein ACHAXR_010806 [Thalassiosira sp. AJA248-18]
MTNKTTPTGSSNDVGEQEPALSEYEQARARNIERNNARLRSLGLISVAEERSSNDMAWGRQILSIKDDDLDDEEDPSSDEEYSEGKVSSKKKKKRSRSALPPREGSRKSRRLMNLPSVYASGDIVDDHESTGTAAERKERIKKEREALVEECRESRQRAAIEVANAGLEMAGTKNPTATYEHCLMRGTCQHILLWLLLCVVKMAIFKSCLQDENMWELAGLASEALERLKALLPPPS